MSHVLCIKNGKSEIMTVEFTELCCGDIIYAGGNARKVKEDAHFSGDSSYDGYLLYDEDNNSWFPDDLATKNNLNNQNIVSAMLQLSYKTTK